MASLQLIVSKRFPYLWNANLLRLLGIPSKIISLLNVVYSWIGSAAECGRDVKLLTDEHGSEADMRPYPITFQSFYGLRMRQSLRPKTKWYDH